MEKNVLCCQQLKQDSDITVNDAIHKYTAEESRTAFNTPRKGKIEIEKFDSDSDNGKAMAPSKELNLLS